MHTVNLFLFQLDQEIIRLERLLELPIEPYPRLTEELLYLLPESRVDPSPTHKRRRLQEKDMYVIERYCEEMNRSAYIAS